MNTKWITALALAACGASPAVAQPASDLNVSLACDGRASFDVSDSNGTIGNVLDDTSHREETKGRVRLKFAQGEGEVKFPATVPGGGDIWRPLRELSVDDAAIRGQAKLGFLNSVRIAIDRRNGEIEVSGRINFSGVCEKDEDRADERKF